MTGIVAVILAGGRATRMGGGDKCLLPLAGRSLLDHLLPRLRDQVGRVALSANGDPERFRRFRVPVLPDERGGAGPLAGLSSALRWARAEGADAVLTVPGDTPFIPRDLCAALAPAPAVAVSRGRRHHLVALWPASWSDRLDRYLGSLPPDAPRRARGALAFAATGEPMREARFADGPDGDPFFNINEPDDLVVAGRRVAQERG